MYTTYNPVAREELVKQHPEAVRRVLAAFIRATAVARSDPVAAVRAMARGSGFDEAVSVIK